VHMFVLCDVCVSCQPCVCVHGDLMEQQLEASGMCGGAGVVLFV
jgi:hypothetical protein